MTNRVHAARRGTQESDAKPERVPGLRSPARERAYPIPRDADPRAPVYAGAPARCASVGPLPDGGGGAMPNSGSAAQAASNAAETHTGPEQQVLTTQIEPAAQVLPAPHAGSPEHGVEPGRQAPPPVLVDTQMQSGLLLLQAET